MLDCDLVTQIQAEIALRLLQKRARLLLRASYGASTPRCLRRIQHSSST